jgi:polyisoprenyl-phosphate glycosyltransferase
MHNKNSLSIVVSVFNEENNIKLVYKDIKKYIPSSIKNYEIIFVNDGSTDNSLEEMKKLLSSDKNIKIVNLSKNFGHEIAMTAGMDHSKMDAIIFMDADLQHPAKYIPQMVKLWKENNQEVVLTRRVLNRDYSIFNNITNFLFYKIFNFLSDTKIEQNMSDFRLIDKKYRTILEKMHENNRIFRGMLHWIGVPHNKYSIIEFSAPKRIEGKSKYSFKKSLALAINSIMQFSIKPLRFSIYLGIIANIFSICFGIYTIMEYFIHNKPPTGYTSIVTIIVFMGSVQLIALGIIGEYIGRIHLEVKKRPLYTSELITSNK